MTDPPPPTGPPPGWYPDPGADPGAGPGLRWWDGASWTGQTSLAPPPGNGLAPPGEWLREAIRLASARAGHFLPMVVLLVIPTSLANGLALWFALRRAVLLTDSEAGTVSFDNPSGGAVPYLAVLVTGVIQAAAILLLVVAATRQADAALDERPEPWSASMSAALTRLPRILGLGLTLTAILAGLYLVMVVSAVVPPLLAITVPLWAVGSVLAWVRLALAPTVVALAPPGTPALRTSWDLTRSRFWALFGRLLLVVLIAVMVNIVTSLVATPFVALVGGGSSVPFQPGDERLPIGEILGDNPAVFAIGQLFSALGHGAVTVLFAVGLALIHRRLDGPRVSAAVEPDPAASGPTTPPTGTAGHGF